ncbi:UNVERIFIED_CONTAM: hypothetical protein Slati_4494400 [Sesamum latifolium]|uniref:Reverse transcriptase domain-containing protein n=1 Tax=Sesamum latifolium TaxID=2727402 RepID=A0AAW2SS56_9LAMI
MTRTQALMVVEKNEHLRWPPKMKNDEYRQRSSKYCNFHQDRGHTTEECLHLKEELEMLLQMGHFGELACPLKTISPSTKGGEKSDSKNTLRTLEGPITHPRIINMIEGGSYGSLTRSSHKRHLREIARSVYANTPQDPMEEKEACPITFTEDDEKGVIL